MHPIFSVLEVGKWRRDLYLVVMVSYLGQVRILVLVVSHYNCYW